VLQQTQRAFHQDLGISTPLYPQGYGECTEVQTACRAAPDGNSPQYDNLEAPQAVVDLVVHYARNLAVPPRRDIDDADVIAGEVIFHALGCSNCHVPHFTTASEGVPAALSRQAIAPYTDLLLHDMGEALADARADGLATGREWRTAPLWGLGLTASVSGHTQLLHDGRARTVLEAVLWHGGEAQAARDRVVQLSKPERTQLLRFLESL
jgi:CxxC motif-containing protein (DUF1111 family)